MTRSPSALLLAALAASVACGTSKAPAAQDTSASAAAPAPAPATPAPASDTSHADRDFLRKLADHHKGLIAVAHLVKDDKGHASARALGTRIDKEQDGEVDRIVTLLEQHFKDPYTPAASAADQAMVADMKTKSGAAYQRAFVEHVIAHHTEELAMIDAYLPAASDAGTKALAASIRAALQREIPELTVRIKKGI